jgi:hypothetical protein
MSNVAKTSSTYASKSTAVRGFRRTQQALADGLSNAEIAEKFLRYVATGDGTQHEGQSGWAWAIVLPADIKRVYVLKGVQLRRRSEEPEGVTSAVHGMFDEYEAEEKNMILKRKDAIARAVREGVAYYTARTQYQKWHSNKR